MRVVPAEDKQLQPRPPVASATPAPAGATRPTNRKRPQVRVRLLDDRSDGVAASDPYVRRFWTAVIGPGAVADFLRLIRAGKVGKPITRPGHLADLVRCGLVAHHRKTIWLTESVPIVPAHLVRTTPPFLRREHAAWLAERAST